MKNFKHSSLTFFITILLSACSSPLPEKSNLGKSYLQVDKNGQVNVKKFAGSADELLKGNQHQNAPGEVTYLSSIDSQQDNETQQVDLTQQFSESKLVQLSADDLPLKDYLHHVFGDLLELSYILGEQVKEDNKQVTLNLQENISQRKLFNISEQLLEERGYVVRLEDDIYYIHKEEGNGNKGNIVFGYGKNVKNVPVTASTIVQLVPFTFGMQTSLANTLKQLITIKATPDFQRNTIILQGKRKDIIKALEFINLMDQPIFKNRHIGVYKSTYVSTEELMKQLPELLKQEGVSVSSLGQNDLAVSIVPLDRIGTIILFANTQTLIERTGFWAKQVDQAPSGNQLQYFLYQPQFARATDLGESLQMLISGGSSSGETISSGTSAASQNQSNNQSTNNRSNSRLASNQEMSLVVDERANALIFNTTGDKYRQLIPLIKRLDVMPKQVMLEVMIAEVKLSDEFKQGVDFVLTNQGNAAQVGGFNLSNGAGGLTYLLSGTQGSLTVNLMQTNSNVNVISRPSLLVRDGVVANITVGDDIPTVGSIVTDPVNGSQTSVVYRKTGVELKVKPTINARGVIIMEIDQKISNQASGGSTVDGAPIIFERSIGTEVVAESGQTIVLGGLISQNRTINDTSVPFFSSIPLLGRLFDSTDDSTGKTELVVLVTPRIIESGDEWDNIKAKFSSSFENINIISK